MTCDAAVAATSRGWPVVPGTFLRGGTWTGRAGAAALCPVREDWERAAVRAPGAAVQLWAVDPFGVLLVCGQGVDVLEVPCRRPTEVDALTRVAGQGAAIATVLPPPRWLLFVSTSDGGLLPELAEAGVVLRGAGEWVALPPTVAEGPAWAQVSWVVEPGAEELPDCERVQRSLAQVLTD